MKVQKVTDEAFKKYGQLVKGVDFSEVIAVLKDIPCPEGDEYVAAYDELEKPEIRQMISTLCYGELSVELGYCCGHNNKMNALEYHRTSEINLAVTDVILLVGIQSDITDDFTYDTKNLEAFFVPAGTAVEMYGTTLHFVPFGTKENDYAFRTAVILPYGTNFPLGQKPAPVGEGQLLYSKNKWLIAHEECVLPDVYKGIVGKNITADDLEF